MTKHIAGSGARVGQWVNCPAQKCRLGGSHISEREFYATKAWLQETGNKKLNKDMTKEDVENFQTSTKGEEDKWAKKAEFAARKAKGLKNPTHQVFAGEKNLVNIDPNRKFVPAGSRKTPTSAKEVFTGKASPAPLPPGARYIDIPGVRKFMLTGDINQIVQAKRDYNLKPETINAVAGLRVRMVDADPNGSVMTNSVTGKQSVLADIPEVRDYINTGNTENLSEVMKDYGLNSTQKEIVKGARESRIKKEKAENKAAAKNKRTSGPEKPAEDKEPSKLRDFADRMKAASVRLTNVTDDLSKLTSNPNDSKEPAGKDTEDKGFFGKIFG